MPMPGKPLHAKYHSPYTVEQQVGPVDYVISTSDRRNTKRVCQVNLLKPYHERDPELDPVVTSIASDVVVHSPVMEEMECPAPTSVPTSVPVVETLFSKADGQLTSTQTEDLTALMDVFSDVPGRTTLGVHHIEMKPDTKPIVVAGYRSPRPEVQLTFQLFLCVCTCICHLSVRCAWGVFALFLTLCLSAGRCDLHVCRGFYSTVDRKTRDSEQFEPICS